MTTSKFGKMSRVGACLAMGAAGLLGSATPAEAASTGWVFISAPTWLGSCPQGGSVVELHGTVDNLWTTPPRGDRGDDLVYAKVRLGASSRVQFQPICSRPWYRGGNYRGVPFTQSIRATRNKQTIWVGPAGVRY